MDAQAQRVLVETCRFSSTRYRCYGRAVTFNVTCTGTKYACSALEKSRRSATISVLDAGKSTKASRRFTPSGVHPRKASPFPGMYVRGVLFLFVFFFFFLLTEADITAYFQRIGLQDFQGRKEGQAPVCAVSAS